MIAWYYKLRLYYAPMVIFALCQTLWSWRRTDSALVAVLTAISFAGATATVYGIGQLYDARTRRR